MHVLARKYTHDLLHCIIRLGKRGKREAGGKLMGTNGNHKEYCRFYWLSQYHCLERSLG